MDIYDYLRDAITPEIKSMREDLEDFERETKSLEAEVDSRHRTYAMRATSIDNKIVASMAKAMNEKLAGKWIALKGDADFAQVSRVYVGVDANYRPGVIKIDTECAYTTREFNPFIGYESVFHEYAAKDIRVPIVNADVLWPIREATPEEVASILIHRAWMDCSKPEFKCSIGDKFILRLENVRSVLMVGEGSTTVHGYTITSDENNIYLDEKKRCICGDCECVVKKIKGGSDGVPHVVLRTTDMENDDDNDSFTLNYGECALMLEPKAR